MANQLARGNDYGFALDAHIIHLNHAAVAPWPERTRQTVCDFAAENTRVGSQHYDRWLQTESRLRQQLANLIHADSPDEIALLKNTSEGLSVVAHGLPWQAGDNVVIPRGEFPSNRIVWQALETQGVELRQVDIHATGQPERTLLAATDRRTRLLACSSVQYASGLRLNLAMLGEACRQGRILFCVDAIQSLGALAFDVNAARADFVVADGHKWLCGPEGVALFYCRASVMDQLRLHQHGWHMVEEAYDFDREDWRPAASARRFECGSPNMLGIAALNSSLDVLFDSGMETIEHKVLANSEYLFEVLDTLCDIEIVTPQRPGGYGGIVSFRHRRVDNSALYQHLQANDVICALRGGAIRFSPHYYTTLEKMARAIEIVRNFAATKN